MWMTGQDQKSELMPFGGSSFEPLTSRPFVGYYSEQSCPPGPKCPELQLSAWTLLRVKASPAGVPLTYRFPFGRPGSFPHRLGQLNDARDYHRSRMLSDTVTPLSLPLSATPTSVRGSVGHRTLKQNRCPAEGPVCPSPEPATVRGQPSGTCPAGWRLFRVRWRPGASA